VELGQVLLLRLPLPMRLREHDLSDASYLVYSLVRGVRRRSEQPRVGVMFFGKQPPRGFHERPFSRYLLPGDSLRGPTLPGGPLPEDTPTGPLTAAGPGSAQAEPQPGVPPAPVPGTPSQTFLQPQHVGEERRSAPRTDVFVNFVLQQVDEWGTVLQEELTVADNVGRGGARVLTAHGFKVGDTVLVQEAGGGFATRAEVRGITRFQATVDRLHLRFIDRQAPDRLLH
jgi:hypothetical protein